MTHVGAEKLVDAVVDAMIEALKTEGVVSLSGFGAFRVKTRRGREGINPFTKQPMSIPPTKNISFKIAQKLKEEL